MKPILTDICDKCGWIYYPGIRKDTSAIICPTCTTQMISEQNKEIGLKMKLEGRKVMCECCICGTPVFRYKIIQNTVCDECIPERRRRYQLKYRG